MVLTAWLKLGKQNQKVYRGVQKRKKLTYQGVQ